MRHRLILAVALSLIAGSGLAGGLSDPIIPAPLKPIAQPNDWYAGLQLGPASGDYTPEIIVTGLSPRGVDATFYGLHGGVQRHFGSFTLGAEIDYNTSSSSIEIQDAFFDANIETLAHLKLRAGTKVGPALVYGTAGIAHAAGVLETVGGPLDVSDTAGFYGIGADFMVTGRISVGAEVLIHNFENMDDTGNDVDFTTAMLRASYHF